MEELTGKNILLGITGGIAAYKSAVLCRDLIRMGAEVRVIMTEAATHFITPLTLQALSGHPVHSDLFAVEAEHGMGHIKLARWADRVLIAPASAQTIARLAHGEADNLLTTTVLASEAPLLIAPAMNTVMWQDAAMQGNIDLMLARGVTILGPASGDQACGEDGLGRMLEPSEIIEHLQLQLQPELLVGKNIVITAGPTWEAIDPVRGLTNHSSGKMGFALASALHDAGANVKLISGPVHLRPPHGVDCINITSALEMADTVKDNISDCDIFVAVAAVADYRPVTNANQKIKKKAETLTLELVRNPDILAMVAALENAPFTVGFAAETENITEYAAQKLAEKRIDLIAANPVSGDNSAFDSESNELTLFDRNGNSHLSRCSKSLLAQKLTKEIAQRYHETYPAKDT
ncbi:coenzyme A biosynthesis bifunctional protein CoaBC [bacterium BMS3Bbin11]|nr:coenzyme A biosynthesis bifunctional protein CoaBC [bacterium BMS3Abin11]GBE46388.1 coenzyme A biosynthesis bifunctional protein CoaBC [bacterium BMS3Bbin11]GMT40154.1 MAG: coenzyme A biosynthesis bifunctional protein CoaBC [bacterium]HDH17123.1 bifunctional phosphopantothenoylcysteine decarboxylase/phosphopantothenate--cysteine ligase CoaBC [Gammaproteobacteria bacterium]